MLGNSMHVAAVGQIPVAGTLHTHQGIPSPDIVHMYLHEANVEGLKFERTNVNKMVNRTAEFLSVNPLGEVPCLVVEGESIADSSTICRYLDDVATEGTGKSTLRANHATYTCTV